MEKMVKGSKKSIEDNLVNFIVMSESLEDNGIIYDLESEHKTSNMNPFVITQSMFEILEMLNSSDIQLRDLINLFLNSSEQNDIFSFEFSQNLFNIRSINSHIESHHLLNSSIDIDLPAGSFLACSNSLIKDSFNGNSSTGCQSILSQNSQSSSVTSPVCLYLTDISCLSNFINNLPSNTELTLLFNSLGISIFNSAINNKQNLYYINFSGGRR